MMKALTLRRPWADCVARFGKDIENRGWAVPSWLIGHDLAIHSGKCWLEDGDEGYDVFGFDYGGMNIRIRKEESTVSAIVAVVTVGANLTKSDSPWFFGPNGWQLLHTRSLATPVPCRGAQGLWDLPTDIEAEVRRQIGSNQ